MLKTEKKNHQVHIWRCVCVGGGGGYLYTHTYTKKIYSFQVHMEQLQNYPLPRSQRSVKIFLGK